MQHSDRPYVELDLARRAASAMRQSRSLVEVEEHWKEFLGRLERVWNKSANHFGKSPKWNAWQGPFLKLRKHDQLLSYLINARGADEHTISEITKKENGTLTVNAGPSGAVHIRRMAMVNGILAIDADGEAAIDIQQPRVRLLPITNRGVRYDVPLQHLSGPVDPDNLIDIAEKGIDFYAKFLDQAEVFFVKAG